MRTVTKKGHADWEDLIGKTITFPWSDGWEDYHPLVVFTHTEPIMNEGWPIYYICGEGGGYSVRESEEVQVTVHD